ncbi:hypothetical protein ACTAQJ_13610 [Arthrobacter sp. alpha11c]
MSESTLYSTATALPQFRDVAIPLRRLDLSGALPLTEATAGKSRDRNGLLSTSSHGKRL